MGVSFSFFPTIICFVNIDTSGTCFEINAGRKRVGKKLNKRNDKIEIGFFFFT